jgi:hypothetical protein
MSTLSQFTGQRVTKTLANGRSNPLQLTTATSSPGLREVLSGALTAATLKTLLTISAPGEIFTITAYTKNATSRTLRCRVTLDGVVVFDATSGAIAAAGTGMLIAGGDLSSATLTVNFGSLRFNQSCVVEVASSLTETDTLAIGYAAQTY